MSEEVNTIVSADYPFAVIGVTRYKHHVVVPFDTYDIIRTVGTINHFRVQIGIDEKMYVVRNSNHKVIYSRMIEMSSAQDAILKALKKSDLEKYTLKRISFYAINIMRAFESAIIILGFTGDRLEYALTSNLGIKKTSVKMAYEMVQLMESNKEGK